jgi:hypothetical protein
VPKCGQSLASDRTHSDKVAAMAPGRKSSSAGKVSMNTPYSQAFGDSIGVTFLVSFCASDFARPPEEVDLLPLSWTKHAVNPLPEA